MTNDETTCDGCGDVIEDPEAIVYADGGKTYHMGCDMADADIVKEVGDKPSKSYKITDELE